MKHLNKALSLGLALSLCVIPNSIVNMNTVVLAADQTTIPVADKAAEVGKISKVTVSFYGDPTTAKGFTWYTSKASIYSDLQIVEKRGDTPDFNKAKSFKGTCAVPTNKTDAAPPANTTTVKPEFVHKAEAAGLKPNTTYFYRVGDAVLNLWSETATFKTAPTSGAFTFIDLADPQAKEYDEAVLAAKTFKKAMATVKDADFTVLNGDIVDDGKVEYEWDWLFNNIGSGLLNTTIAPIAGNHENSKDAFIDHFDLSAAPNSDTSSGAYYSYNYSNAHFVMLNTNENSEEYNDFTPEQVEWMKADIENARENGSKWIIVTMHKGPYTTSNHATDKDIAGSNGVRNQIAPIMSQLGIDLVLQGHDHIYARSKPIKEDGTSAEETILTQNFDDRNVNYDVNPEGPIYLIPSTAGPKVYYKNKTIDDTYYDSFDVADEHHAAQYGPDPKDETRPVRSQVQNFEGITVYKNKLTVISYEIDQNKNNGEPYIIDSFGIVKE